jgi:hypothetical protein
VFIHEEHEENVAKEKFLLENASSDELKLEFKLEYWVKILSQ